MLQTLDKGLPTAQSSLSLTVINARKISYIEHGYTSLVCSCWLKDVVAVTHKLQSLHICFSTTIVFTL